MINLTFFEFLRIQGKEEEILSRQKRKTIKRIMFFPEWN